MKVLVIPDVHLKPWMVEGAAEIMRRKEADLAVCLMDIADVDDDIDYDDADRVIEEIICGSMPFGTRTHPYGLGLRTMRRICTRRKRTFRL